MGIQFRLATKQDAELIISIQNQAFFEDYKRFGFCPNYNQRMEQVQFILTNREKKYFDYLIYEDDMPVGNMLIIVRNSKECHLSSLCVVTTKRCQGIGNAALFFLENDFLKNNCPDCNRITLETPALKLNNIKFYLKFGYEIVDEVISHNIRCTLFKKEKVRINEERF